MKRIFEFNCAVLAIALFPCQKAEESTQTNTSDEISGIPNPPAECESLE